jgi:aminopeptidase N
MYKVFITAILALSCTILSANDDGSICYLRDATGRIREHNLDFKKMDLDVRFDVKEGRVFGKVKYLLAPIQPTVDSVFLDAVLIKTKQVLMNGKPLTFNQDSAGLTVFFNPPLNWNSEYSFTIDYEAAPRKGIYFLGWNIDTKNSANDKNYTRKQIWTQGQGIDNRHWIPCYDDVNDKLITETKITFDSTYAVISNGILKSRKVNADGTATWNYSMNKPMVPYLIMLAIDKYSYKDYRSKNGMVSRQYYYSDFPEMAASSYRYSDEIMDFLEGEFGVKYPWQTYANVPVQNFMYGAMENTTATIFGDFLLNDERQNIERPYYSTNAHELTHQWFGDYITEYSAQHHWLHESFATYYAKQFMRFKFGENKYDWEKRTEANNAIGADNTDRFPVAHSRGGSQRHYPKGSYVIDMIRYVVGDSIFKKCITSYLKEHAYGNVHNHDLMMAFMDYAGINLDWFFDEWIYRSGYPIYDVSYSQTDTSIVFFVQQKQKTDELTGVFKMPVVLQVWLKNGSVVTKQFWNEKVIDTILISIPANQEISYILFDPSSRILKAINFNKDFSLLKAQALNAVSMIDRYDAVCALRETDIESKRDFLIQLFRKHDFHAIQDEILDQLSKDKNTESLQIFSEALSDKDYMVRRSAIDNLEEVSEALLPKFELLLSDSSYNNIENSLRKLCKLYPGNAQKYLDKANGIIGINKNVRMAWLELSLGLNLDSAAKYLLQRELMNYSSKYYEFRTRVKAIEALEKISFCNDEIVRNIFDAMLSTNGRLANPAARVLRILMKKPANKEIAQTVFNTSTWLKWESDILSRYIE